MHNIVKLENFDPHLIVEYAITEVDLTNVFTYLQAMQAHLGLGTWDDISVGGYYGSSALLHEVVEIRHLLNRDSYLLTRTPEEIKRFARAYENYEGHIRALEAEYTYLHKMIYHLFGQNVNIGALLRANSKRPGDWDDLFETDLPFFAPSVDEINEAERLLYQLRVQGNDN